MAHSHYGNIPDWGKIVARIKERDNYICQDCSIEDGTIIFMGQSLFPRYATEQMGKFIFFKPWIGKVNKFLAATPDNIREQRLYKYIEDRDKIEIYPHYFRHLAEERGTDGYKLLLLVQNYIEANPLELESVYQINIASIKARLYVHHIDENKENNKDSNLRTLCHFCHQNEHKSIFLPY